MTDKTLVLTTCGSLEEARSIAHTLVDRQLAACVNITQPIESVYRWQGQIAEEREFLLIVKSTRELFPDIKTAISRIHSYQTPEIICLPVSDGSPSYLQWIADSVKPPDAGEGA